MRNDLILKPCCRCGSPAKWGENGGYSFVFCTNKKCKNCKEEFGFDANVWQKAVLRAEALERGL
jgi:endogenous inhibitor of DNA gyrase (YacG/DUF329 family)